MKAWNHVLTVLGAGLLLTAAVRASYTLFGVAQPPELALLEIVIDATLVGLPGVAMTYAGLALPGTSIPPGLYPRIVAWTGGGVLVAGFVVGLRQLHPAIEITDLTGGTQLVLVSIGSVTGLLAGVLNARTHAQARALERKNRQLRQKAELERRNEQLRRTERHLEEAVDELEASNERLEEFAYAVSHDLQEPLRMVTQYLQLLERRYEDELDEDAEEFVAYAVDGADRMRTMIEGLLEYSRVETRGRSFEPADLDDVLEDVLTDLQFRIEETDTEVSREPLPTVAGDETQLRQVFQNLVSNAIDYAGDEPPRIEVTADREGDRWRIAVSDEGVGIDPRDQDRVFGLFQRLQTVDEADGTGIGLAICERIVERHGGEIGVESEPGAGSTFHVTLPDSDRVESLDRA